MTRGSVKKISNVMNKGRNLDRFVVALKVGLHAFILSKRMKLADKDLPAPDHRVSCFGKMNERSCTCSSTRLQTIRSKDRSPQGHGRVMSATSKVTLSKDIFAFALAIMASEKSRAWTVLPI